MNSYTDNRQVILVRADLKMPKGKAAAQIAHASTQNFISYFQKSSTKDSLDMNANFSKDSKVYDWITNNFTKITLKVDSEEHLFEIVEKAKKIGINTTVIKDIGKTVFNEPTITCACLGIDNKDTINKVTGDLKLY